MQLPKSNVSDLQLLHKELETMGDDLDRERLELRGEIDDLKIQIQALKKSLNQLLPGFDASWKKAYDEELQSFDPESQRELGSSPLKRKAG